LCSFLFPKEKGNSVTSGDMAAENISDETQRYLEEKQVDALMESLFHDLLIALPKKPLDYLYDILDRPPTPKIIISGPPAGGKGTQCEMIAKKYGVVHISTGDILRDHTQRGTEFGKRAESFMVKGMLVPDALITQLVRDRLSQSDVLQRGWLLDGFPRTRSQAISLQTAGIIPNVFIVLDVPDTVVMQRISGRRTDPQTGVVYHVDFNPPPSGIHVVHRSDDTPEAIAVRLKMYHRNLQEVLACYETGLVQIDGNRQKEDIFAEIEQQIDKRVVMV
jgi:adenylate kinase